MTNRPTDIIDRLEQWANLKMGEMPTFIETDPHNGWADPLTKDLKDAIAEIKSLRETAK